MTRMNITFGGIYLKLHWLWPLPPVSSSGSAVGSLSAEINGKNQFEGKGQLVGNVARALVALAS